VILSNLTTISTFSALEIVGLCKNIVSEITYDVSSRTLNLSQPTDHVVLYKSALLLLAYYFIRWTIFISYLTPKQKCQLFWTATSIPVKQTVAV